MTRLEHRSVLGSPPQLRLLRRSGSQRGRRALEAHGPGASRLRPRLAKDRRGAHRVHRTPHEAHEADELRQAAERKRVPRNRVRYDDSRRGQPTPRGAWGSPDSAKARVSSQAGSKPMRWCRYEITKRLVFVFPLVYLLVVAATQIASEQEEIYPFFSWGLYSSVPAWVETLPAVVAHPTDDNRTRGGGGGGGGMSVGSFRPAIPGI